MVRYRLSPKLYIIMKTKSEVSEIEIHCHNGICALKKRKKIGVEKTKNMKTKQINLLFSKYKEKLRSQYVVYLLNYTSFLSRSTWRSAK